MLRSAGSRPQSRVVAEAARDESEIFPLGGLHWTRSDPVRPQSPACVFMFAIKGDVAKHLLAVSSAWISAFWKIFKPNDITT